jgi:hypothetical protein
VKLAADPQIFAVVGTTCSSSALGVADTILSEGDHPDRRRTRTRR